MTDPQLSYIVLSHDYEDYVGIAIRSILDQTVQDLEIVVVDDASTDGSLDVIRGFRDPRIRLLVNLDNIGGASSYNRAVEAATGEWLVNLDADDWISPNKAELQLAAAQDDPSLDIIASYVSYVDEDGAPAPDAVDLESAINQQHEFGWVDTWIGFNPICRSSTMVRRETHMRLGLDDPSMVRAPDYELWTRAVREGCRFVVVPERLTYCRLHARNVTHADPVRMLLEVSYAMLRNLIPAAEARALHPSIGRIISWVARHPSLSALRPIETHRLLGVLMTSLELADYDSFRSAITGQDGEPWLARVGRRCLASVGRGGDADRAMARLQQDAEAFVEARDFWHQQSEAWQRAYARVEGAAVVDS